MIVIIICYSQIVGYKRKDIVNTFQMTQTPRNAYMFKEPVCLKCYDSDGKLYYYGSNRSIMGFPPQNPIVCNRCDEILTQLTLEQYRDLVAEELRREEEINERADA